MLFLGIFVIAYNIYYIFIPLERDEGGYAYVAWVWLTGKGIPYLSVFNQKPPFVFIIYGLGVLLNPNGFMGIRLIGFIYKIFVLIINFKLIRKISNSSIAWVLTLLAAWYLSSIQLQGNEFNSEIIMILPLILFIYTLVILNDSHSTKKKLFLLLQIGVWASIAFLLKTVAVFSIALFMIWFLLKRKNIFETVPIAIGFLFPIIISIWYFLSHHGLIQMINDVITYNHFYVQDGLKMSSIESVSGYKGILGYIVWSTILPKGIIMLTISALVSLFLGIKSRSLAWWVGILLIVSTFLGAKSGGSREFPHYYIPFVFGLIVALIPLLQYFKEKKLHVTSLLLVITLICVVVIPEVPAIIQGPRAILEAQYGIQGNWFYDAVGLGRFIKSNTNNNDTLLVWASEPEIYYYAGKQSTTKYTDFYGYFYSLDEQRKWSEQIHKTPPALLVTYVNDPPSYVTLLKYLSDTNAYKKRIQIGSYLVYNKIDGNYIK